MLGGAELQRCGAAGKTQPVPRCFCEPLPLCAPRQSEISSNEFSPCAWSGAAAFFHPDYTVGGGILSVGQSPHSCRLRKQPGSRATGLRRITADRELRSSISHPAPKAKLCSC